MYESYLIAPTVRGNTADLPTALASIIGLAGMETRVDHGDLSWLGAWLPDRCRQDFDLPEADQPLPPDLLQIRRHTHGVACAIVSGHSCGPFRRACAPGLDSHRRYRADCARP